MSQMNADTFVQLIKLDVRDAAISDVVSKLKKPPGRQVPADKKDRSDWFNSLTPLDEARVVQVIESSVNEAIFGLFAVLDGTRKIAPGQFELFYRDVVREWLNDPSKIGLNEIFKAVD